MRRYIRLLLAALVCAADPSWALEDFQAVTLHSSAISTGNGTAIDVANFTSVALTVTISATATVTFEGSADGATWASRACVSIASTSGTGVTAATATGTYQCNVAGLAQFRARVSSFGSGTITVHARATTATLGGGGGGGAGGGTASDFGATFPSSGTAAGFKDGGGLMQPAKVDGSFNLHVNCQVGCAGSSFADQAAFTAGTTTITNIGGVFNDAIASLTSGQAGAVRLTTDRMLFTNLSKIGGVALAFGQAVMASSIPVVLASNQSAIPTNASQSGTWTVQPGNTANTTPWLTQPQGNVAHDAVDSGNPTKIGCHARTTTRTAVADADRADVLCDKNGKVVVTQSAARERVVRSGVITLTNTTETTLIAAGGAGVFRDVTYLKCTNNSATLVRVDLRDATAGTVIDSWALAASGGGFNLPFPVPYNQATANNNWTVQLSASVTDVRCSAQAVENN